ncbi:hypothetical protein P4O66_014761 [Electrophorus voltai]|uniref:Uncharacterized protein n=1 Tax=Electrophorus voltai TaxID=2609070 RepID=A0AAD8Z0S5_9TELE|nr:hypothetical protein P4O66_014761 [Electrophorus voltai]
MTRQDVNPFGRHADTAAHELADALRAGRALTRAFVAGNHAVNSTEAVMLSRECSRALVRMLYCPHCRGLTLIRPCPPLLPERDARLSGQPDRDGRTLEALHGHPGGPHPHRVCGAQPGTQPAQGPRVGQRRHPPRTAAWTQAHCHGERRLREHHHKLQTATNPDPDPNPDSPRQPQRGRGDLTGTEQKSVNITSSVGSAMVIRQTGYSRCVELAKVRRMLDQNQNPVPEDWIEGAVLGGPHQYQQDQSDHSGVLPWLPAFRIWLFHSNTAPIPDVRSGCTGDGQSLSKPRRAGGQSRQQGVDKLCGKSMTESHSEQPSIPMVTDIPPQMTSQSASLSREKVIRMSSRQTLSSQSCMCICDFSFRFLTFLPLFFFPMVRGLTHLPVSLLAWTDPYPCAGVGGDLIFRSSLPLKPTKSNKDRSLKQIAREVIMYIRHYISFFNILPESMCEGEMGLDEFTCWSGDDVVERSERQEVAPSEASLCDCILVWRQRADLL